jgi:hypothetical protein
LGSEHPFIRPDPACNISVGIAKKAVRDWTNRAQKYFKFLAGLKHAKDFLQGPSARRCKELLQLKTPVMVGDRTLSPERMLVKSAWKKMTEQQMSYVTVRLWLTKDFVPWDTTS